MLRPDLGLERYSMIYGPISAHNSQHRDNPSLWVPHLKGTSPLRDSARDRCTLTQQIDCLGRSNAGLSI